MIKRKNIFFSNCIIYLLLFIFCSILMNAMNEALPTSKTLSQCKKKMNHLKYY